jgi:transcriptional regulator with XRE-family HTH domain
VRQIDVFRMGTCMKNLFDDTAKRTFGNQLKIQRERLSLEKLVRNHPNQDQFLNDLENVYEANTGKIDLIRQLRIESFIQSQQPNSDSKPWTVNSNTVLPTDLATRDEIGAAMGISKDVYSKIERGKQVPSLSQAIAFAVFTNIDITTLLMPTFEQIEHNEVIIPENEKFGAIRAAEWCSWIKGFNPLPHQDPNIYIQETSAIFLRTEEVKQGNMDRPDDWIYHLHREISDEFSGLKRLLLLSNFDPAASSSDAKSQRQKDSLNRSPAFFVLQFLTTLAGTKYLSMRFLVPIKMSKLLEKNEKLTPDRVNEIIKAEFASIGAKQTALREKQKPEIL